MHSTRIEKKSIDLTFLAEKPVGLYNKKEFH